MNDRIRYLIVSTESFQKGVIPEPVIKYLATDKDPLILLDESSQIKTSRASRAESKSHRTRAIQALNQIGQRGILTGTFMPQSPVDAWDQMEFLKHNYFGMTMFQFRSRYVVCETLAIGRGITNTISEDTWGRVHRQLVNAEKRGESYLNAARQSCAKNYGVYGEDLEIVMKNEKYSPWKRLDELWDKVKECCMVAHRKDCTDLPDKIFVHVPVTLSDKMSRLYDDLVVHGYTKYSIADNPMSLYHQCQDICNGYIPVTDDSGTITGHKFADTSKLDAVLAYIDSIDLSKQQVVVWSNRKLILRKVHAAIKEHTGLMCACLDGDTNQKDRELIKERFSSGECRIACVNQSTGSYGLDYLGSANYALYICADHSVTKWQQSNDRIDRLREDTSVQKTIVVFTTSGTVEERVLNALKRGVDLLESGTTDYSVFQRFVPGELKWDDGTDCIF